MYMYCRSWVFRAVFLRSLQRSCLRSEPNSCLRFEPQAFPLSFPLSVAKYYPQSFPRAFGHSLCLMRQADCLPDRKLHVRRPPHHVQPLPQVPLRKDGLSELFQLREQMRKASMQNLPERVRKVSMNEPSVQVPAEPPYPEPLHEPWLSVRNQKRDIRIHLLSFPRLLSLQALQIPVVENQ